MYFRSQRKSAQDVSLSDYIDTGVDGAPLELMDVVAEDTDLLEQICSREQAEQLREAVEQVLSPQERQEMCIRDRTESGSLSKIAFCHFIVLHQFPKSVIAHAHSRSSFLIYPNQGAIHPFLHVSMDILS